MIQLFLILNVVFASSSFEQLYKENKVHQAELARKMETDYKHISAFQRYRNGDFELTVATKLVYLREQEYAFLYKFLEENKDKPYDNFIVYTLLATTPFEHLNGLNLDYENKPEDRKKLEMLVHFNAIYLTRHDIIQSYFENTERFQIFNSESDLRFKNELFRSTYFKEMDELYSKNRIDKDTFKLALQEIEFWRKKTLEAKYTGERVMSFRVHLQSIMARIRKKASPALGLKHLVIHPLED